MSATQAISTAKAVAGLAIAALLAISYAMAFAYTSAPVVYSAMAISFMLLVIPIAMNLLGRPMRRRLAYYVCVAAILFLGVMGRFVLEGLGHAT